MKKTPLIVSAIVVFVVGGVLGFVCNAFAIMPQLQKLQKMQGTVTTLSLKMVYPMTVSGTVASIDGNTLTLKNGQENFTIVLNSDATISSIVRGASTDGGTTYPITQVKSQVSDIKVGNSVSLGVKVMSDGSLSAQSATIMTVTGPANH